LKPRNQFAKQVIIVYFIVVQQSLVDLFLYTYVHTADKEQYTHNIIVFRARISD